MDSTEFSANELGSARFEALMSAEPPDNLFHYTNQEGFLGIISSGEFWATKVQYMNDSMEFGLATALAKRLLNARIQGDQSSSSCPLFKRLLESIDAISNVNLASVSFCVSSDLLSQWRGYGARGGLSIGFRSSILKNLAIGSTGRLGRCLYDVSDQTAILGGVIDDAVHSYQISINSSPDQLPSICGRFEKALIKFGAFFKDPGFREEEEWRLVTSIVNYIDERFCFRPGKSMLIPYFKFKVREEPTWGEEITSVTVGPCPHPEISAHAINGALMKTGISPGITSFVSNSRIPFRNW
jgi:hypothetical protein